MTGAFYPKQAVARGAEQVMLVHLHDNGTVAYKSRVMPRDEAEIYLTTLLAHPVEGRVCKIMTEDELAEWEARH